MCYITKEGVGVTKYHSHIKVGNGMIQVLIYWVNARAYLHVYVETPALNNLKKKKRTVSRSFI